MGVIKHHGMFITSYSKKAINKARKTAVSIFHNEIKKVPYSDYAIDAVIISPVR